MGGFSASQSGVIKKSKAFDRDRQRDAAPNPYGSYLLYGFFLPRSPELSKNLKRSGETAGNAVYPLVTFQ